MEETPARPPKPPKPRIGAKPKLTPELQTLICDKVAACASMEDAALLAGIDTSTVWRWCAKGTTQKRGIYRAFFNAVELAKAQRRTGLKAQMRVHARTSWQAAAALGAITDPGEFVPQLREHVEQQLDSFLDRLQAEFSNEPEIYERILRAGSLSGSVDAYRPLAESVTEQPTPPPPALELVEGEVVPDEAVEPGPPAA